MNKLERTITIHCPLEDVFAYVCEVEHGPRYIGGQREAHKTSNGPLALGSTFATTGKFPHRGSTFDITEYDLNHRVAWQDRSNGRALTTWDFQSSGPSTRITFTREANAHGLSGLAERVLPGRASGQVDRDLGALKELLAVTRTPARNGW